MVRKVSARVTPAEAAWTVCSAAATVRKASAVTEAISKRVRLRVASDWERAASAASTLARRNPKSNGSQETRTPTALPHTVPKLFEPITGPDIDGITLCGSMSPKTLLRVARLICASASTFGRYAVRAS